MGYFLFRLVNMEILFVKTPKTGDRTRKRKLICAKGNFRTLEIGDNRLQPKVYRF